MAETTELLGVVKPVSGGPARSLSWSTPEEQFVTTALRHMRTGLAVPLHCALTDFPVEIVKAVQAESWDDAAGLLDRLTRLTAIGITAHQDDLTEICLRSLKRMYVQVFRRQEHVWQDRRSTLARLILERLMALGGLAVRLWSWKAIPLLVEQFSSVEDPHEKTWIQQCHSEACTRGTLPPTIELRHSRYWSVQLAEEYTRSKHWLSSDVVEEKDVTASICQFDALAMIVVRAMTRDDAGKYYASFVHRHAHLTEPIVTELVTNNSMRRAVLTVSDGFLAETLRQINKLGQTFGFSLGRKEAVRLFLTQHSDPNNSQ